MLSEMALMSRDVHLHSFTEIVSLSFPVDDLLINFSGRDVVVTM